jgi:dihydroorotase-like cyclic amidohydrolase
LNIFDSKQHPGFDRGDGIDILDIAVGLKELVRKNKLTLDRLVQLTPSQLADILGIDGYVAKIILESAKGKASLVYAQK